MAQRITQVRGQNVTGSTATQRWRFSDFDDILAVDSVLQGFLSGPGISWGGLPIDLAGRQITEIGYREFEVTIPFSAKAGSITPLGAEGVPTQQAPQHGGSGGENTAVLYDISYSVDGTTQHITQSIETLQSQAVGVGVTARNFGRAIGVDPDTGEVAGVDVVTGEVTFSRTVQIPAGRFTGAYARVIEDLLCDPIYGRSCVNAAPFFGYDIGEVLIRSASVSEVDSGGQRKGNFSFAVKRNRTLITISEAPNLLELYDVYGWSHIWVTYKEQTVEIDEKMKKALLPFEAFEEKVYPFGDFSALRIEEFQVAPPE